MRKRILAMLLGVSLVATALIGCGSGTKTNEETQTGKETQGSEETQAGEEAQTSNESGEVKMARIGVLMFDYDGDQGRNVKAYCEELSKTMELEFEFVQYEAGGSNHLDCVDELITQGVDGIITTFADSGMDVTMKACEDAEVYLAHYAAVPGKSDYDLLSASQYYLGAIADGNADYSTYGAKAAEVAVNAGLKHIGVAGFPFDAKPEMAEIEKGFRDTLAELDSEVEVYDYHNVFFTADNGTDVYLSEHPEMDGFFGMGSGIFFNYPAITEANKSREQKVTMLTCGIYTDDATKADFESGSIIFGTAAPIEGVIAPIVLMFDKINGNVYDDMPEKAPLMSSSNLYVTNADELDTFLESTCYGTPGKYLISVEETKNMSKTYNADATFAELETSLVHLSLEEIAASN